MELSYEKFQANPVMYIVFLPLLALAGLFFLLNNSNKNRLEDKVKEAFALEKRIERLEQRNDRLDSINNRLYFLLGVKSVIDSLK